MKISIADLRVLIETVIDAKSKFAEKRKKDVNDKINHLVTNFPMFVQEQEENEKQINGMLNDIESIVDKHVSVKRARLMMPEAFSDNEFGPNASLFSIISYSLPDDRWQPQLKQFVHDNAEKFIKAQSEIRDTLHKIETHADSLTWHAGWKRYTRWGSSVHNINAFHEKLEKLLN